MTKEEADALRKKVDEHMAKKTKPKPSPKPGKGKGKGC